MSDARETLRRGIGGFAPRPDGYDRVLRRRDRRRRNQRITAGALAAAIVLIGVVAFVEAFRSQPRPADHGIGPTNTRPVFQRTATIGGLTVTSPSDWYLVDYWGAYNVDDPGELGSTTIPVLELTNFDPGLSTPVCAAGPGEPTRLPADGVAILVTVGEDGSDGADLCGGSIEASSTGIIDLAPYRAVMTVGPDVSDEDRAAAQEIWRSLEWTGFTAYTRMKAPAYVLDGWMDGELNWLFEAARQPKRRIELYVIAPNSHYGAGELIDPQSPDPIQGETVGAVTEVATQVEHRRAGVATPLVGRLLDLPPSLASSLDAYVFEQQPTGGTSETVAIGAGGEVLGSNRPPLVYTERVGTVRAFGASWAVKISSAADGYLSTPCVEPVTNGSTLSPCEQGWGGGIDVQSFDKPTPAVFVSLSVGEFTRAIDLQADDGRVFHPAMLPVGPGEFVAVFALEGGGRGRFVYHLKDGRTDQGRRPEAHVEWSDVRQVIGNGSFPPPD